MKLLWILLLLLSIGASWYLYSSLGSGYSSTNDENFKDSPNVRIKLASHIKKVSLRIDQGHFEIWQAGSDKPYHLKKKTIEIEVHQGKFVFEGMHHRASWIEFIPSEGYFRHGKGLYPGKARVYALKDDHLALINHLQMEPYIARVVEGELNSNWPLETLKAQAIASRTYALFMMEENKRRIYDLYGTSRHQAYRAAQVHSRTLKAVHETYGITLGYRGKTFISYYISTCGGKTSPVSQSIPSTPSIPPLGGVVCPNCKKSPFYEWSFSVGRAQFNELISTAIHKNYDISKIVLLREKDFQVKGLRLYSGKNEIATIGVGTFRKSIRQWAGKSKLLSHRFSVRAQKHGWLIEGNGWGYHGVGMCQYGARSMGEHFKTCRDILKFYYPGCEFLSTYSTDTFKGL